ncbi:hypothetical protein [Candidatus Liberibacter solanacearum]|uniref:hypothetical protein n=1 Tax=Candidatus Liberibacter solanacearum TaxID=556287 RepID=UPI001180E5C3|nr:hypothetical protein [Candidatus Liberibacter solanacearum]
MDTKKLGLASTMIRSIALGLCSLFLFTGYPAFAYKTDECHGYSKSGACKNVYVKGYCKRNGTCVSGYYRSSPNRWR